MHILYVWPYWHYPQVAIEFLEKVKSRGHRVSVLVGSDNVGAKGECLDGGIDVYFASRWDGLSRVVGGPYPVFGNVSGYLKMINPDLVHVNSHLFFSSYQVVSACNSLGIPSVITIHGFIAERGFALNYLQEVYVRTVGKSILEKASGVICLTGSDAASVASVAGSYAKISVIPNGVDTDFFRLGSAKDSGLIVWVGRFVPEKGLGDLLRAMRIVSARHSGARLVLVGDGPLRSELVNLARRLGVAGKVEFVGAVSRSDVAELLGRSAVFVFPSSREGLPFSILEAMSCGTPVVGSDIPGINDVVNHNENGLLVPPKNPEELANAILSLLNNKSMRKRLSQNARRLIVEKYGLNNAIAELESVYATAVRQHLSCGLT